MFTSTNLYFTLMWFFFLVISTSVKMSLMMVGDWLVYVILIFIIGGLMISFSYTVSITPNWRNLKMIRDYGVFGLVGSIYMSNDVKFNSYPKFDCFSNNSYSNLSLFPSHYNWTFYLFMLLIAMLLYMDKIIAAVKRFNR
uniref:NADH dehydrogenase subunit 6 n=1 Tax=Liposcelis decolor TaxID=209926 RepID=X2BZU2_9NEOP|nr:NADH dehydrogenase subunit 6 [Liposcelis decolor]AFV61891.1 NADH dehydrogenase subunit 6 [Liposcelis decolor]